MANPSESSRGSAEKPSEAQSDSSGGLARLVFSWAWAGVPLAWGVTQTFAKAMALFH